MTELHMNVFKYDNEQTAISDLEKLYPVPRDHYKKGAHKNNDFEVQRSKEFHVFIRFLKTSDPFIKYPIEVEHCGDREGFPDFIFISDGTKSFIEVSEITDKESQLIYQGQKDANDLGIIGTVDLTQNLKSRIEAKNIKLAQYAFKTGTPHSILLLYHNQWPPFSYGSAGDELRLDEIESHFDQTFLFLPVYKKADDYLKM